MPYHISRHIYFFELTDHENYYYNYLGKVLFPVEDRNAWREEAYGSNGKTKSHYSNDERKQSDHRGQYRNDRGIEKTGRSRTSLEVDETKENIYLRRNDEQGDADLDAGSVFNRNELKNKRSSISKMQDESSASFNLQTIDMKYLDAVERGDMTTARRMVDEAAKAAGMIHDILIQ